MNLARILQRDMNNLDIFRVLAAAMVIFNHAYALAPEPGYSDWTRRTLGFDSTGTLAVKIFFFLSGLVVTNSLLAKQQHPWSFVVARFCRIWPALVVVVVMCAGVLGPMLSTLSVKDYFHHGAAFFYVLDNLALQISYALPGVFAQNPYPNVVNGSLWTIPYEVSAYVILFALFLAGLLKCTNWLAALIFVVILIDPLTGNKLLFTWLPPKTEVTLLAPCFAFGALLAIYKDKVTIKLNIIVSAWILFALFKQSACNFYFFYFALFCTLLYLSSQKWLLRLKPKADISYGMYLWGFPVQQIMAQYFAGYGVRFNQLTSIAICVVLGLASWHLVEKKFIRLSKPSGRTINTSDTSIP